MVRFGEFELKRRERELWGPSGRIELTGRAFDLLAAFLGAPDTVLNKDALFAAAWPGLIVEDNTLQVHISALRKALPPGSISTVHGRGYKYTGPTPDTRPQPAESFHDGAPAAPGAAGNIERYQLDCVAREAESEALKRLIAQHRLVTIVGPGGVGKTTLALAVAGSLPRGSGGIWMIDLAAIESGAFIVSTLIQALGVPFQAGGSARASVTAHLSRGETMLIFDNCEHVRVDAARVIQGLLGDVPGLKILATSQVPLGVAAERVFRLMPFAVGEVGDAGSPSARFLAYCYERYGEQLKPTEGAVVGRLCRRLDGVALALKMAASRAAAIGLETVDGQLERQLAGLEADWDTTLPRHRSLTASLEWSYDLLSPADQLVLRDLAVFQGSFSLPGVRAVAGEGAEARVAELVRHSLVVRDAADGTRYRLLDSTRRFALDKQLAAGEEQEARAAHAAYVMALFGESIEQWETMRDAKWVATYGPDGDNLRAALSWAKAQGRSETYAAIAAHSWRYFCVEQLGAEGLAVIEAAEPSLGELDPRTAARLRHAIGEVCRFNAMDIRARAALLPALEWLRGSDDSLRYWQALAVLTWGTLFFRPEGEADPLVEELRAQLPKMPTSKTKAWSLIATGMRMWQNGETEAGLARARAGLAMHIERGNPSGRFRSVMNFGEILHNGGATREAVALVEGALPDLRTSGLPLQLANHLSNVVVYKFALGDPEGAGAALREAASIAPRDDTYWYMCLLQCAVEWRLHKADARNAAILLGIIDKRIADWPDGRQGTEQKQRDRLDILLAEALGAKERDRLLAQGASLGLNEAIELAGFDRLDGAS